MVPKTSLLSNSSNNYNLSSASIVQSAVKLLLKNDLLTKTDTGYRVYDFFLSDWLANVY